MLDRFLRAGDIIAKQAAFALRRVSQECILGITLAYNGVCWSGLDVLMFPSFLLGIFVPEPVGSGHWRKNGA